MAFRVGFVSGVSPDKWALRWRERLPDEPLDLVPLDQAEQREALDDGRVDMCFVRLPVDRAGLHLIPLYSEVPVVVVPKDHVATAYDEVPLGDLADEQLVLGDVPGWAELARVPQLPFPAMSVPEAIEVVASGTGVVVVPMSLARLHGRKDVVHRPVLGVPQTEVGLAWRDDLDDPRVETFVGIVRGRTANSSRGESASSAKKPPRRDARRPVRKRGKGGGRGGGRGRLRG